MMSLDQSWWKLQMWMGFGQDFQSTAVVEDLKANEESTARWTTSGERPSSASHGEWNALYWQTSPLHLCALYLMCWFCLLCLCLSWWSSIWVGWGFIFVVVVVYGQENQHHGQQLWCYRHWLVRQVGCLSLLVLALLCCYGQIFYTFFHFHCLQTKHAVWNAGASLYNLDGTCMYLHKTGTLK